MTRILPGAGNRSGDFDYDLLGHGYTRERRADPRIAAHVHEVIGSARTILNVGAGTGSYEPEDRYVLAIEPSAVMRAQRPSHLAPAINGVAENLPLHDLSVDASMALITAHQWTDLNKGLRELRRVTRGPVVVLTFDPERLDGYWLAHYVPELIAAERRRMPRVDAICEGLGGVIAVRSVPIPIDCIDGFAEAFYARPEQFLNPAVRQSQSAWGFVSEEVQARFAESLGRDLELGRWDELYGEWRRRPSFDGSLRLIVSQPSSAQ